MDTDEALKKFAASAAAINLLYKHVQPVVLKYYQDFTDIDEELVAFAKKYNLGYNPEFKKGMHLKIEIDSGTTASSIRVCIQPDPAAISSGIFYVPIEAKDREHQLNAYKVSKMSKLQKNLEQMRLQWKQMLGDAERELNLKQEQVKYLKEMMGNEERQSNKEERAIELSQNPPASD